MLQHADVIIDLQAGDTGKGKVAHHLLKQTNYDAVLRFNGGGNAGHTVYHNGEKIVTHAVPMGVLHNIPSIIGPGCVVNVKKLQEEILMLRSHGFRGKVMVDRRVHVTTDAHVEEDSKDDVIGTTKQGIGPTYRDKYSRTGVRIEDHSASSALYEIVDVYDLFYKTDRMRGVLCEGAQGFQLDIDWGDYPYVTSSSCVTGAVFLNGVAPRHLRNVYGIMKAYETYSGFKTFNLHDEDLDVFEEIVRVGGEFGATTGRKRQIRWLHLDDVVKALYLNNVTHLIINKIDVLETVNVFGAVHNNQKYYLHSVGDFKNFVEQVITQEYQHQLKQIIWSSTPEAI